MVWLSGDGVALASGLLGAVLGSTVSAVTTWTVTGRQIRAQERTRHRNALVVLVGETWGAADQLWNARRSLGMTIFELVLERRDSGAVTESRAERFAYLEINRQEAFTQIREAETTLGRCLGMLRISEPGLAVAASELRKASIAYDHRAAGDPDVEAPVEKARSDALSRFEAEAAKALRD